MTSYLWMRNNNNTKEKKTHATNIANKMRDNDNGNQIIYGLFISINSMCFCHGTSARFRGDFEIRNNWYSVQREFVYRNNNTRKKKMWTFRRHFVCFDAKCFCFDKLLFVTLLGFVLNSSIGWICSNKVTSTSINLNVC